MGRRFFRHVRNCSMAALWAVPPSSSAGERRATVLPWRVIATVSPYSTTRRSSARCALASVADTSRIAIPTGHYNGLDYHRRCLAWNKIRNPLNSGRRGDPCGRPLVGHAGTWTTGRDNAARPLVASPSGPSPHRPRGLRLATAPVLRRSPLGPSPTVVVPSAHTLAPRPRGPLYSVRAVYGSKSRYWRLFEGFRGATATYRAMSTRPLLPLMPQSRS